MSLILDALRKARDKRPSAFPDPYVIVGGSRRFAREGIFTKKSILAILGSVSAMGIAVWFLLSPKLSQDRIFITASGERTKQTQAVRSQALDTRPAEQTKLGTTQGVSPPGSQSTVEATTSPETKSSPLLTTERPKAMDAPFKPIPRPGPTAEALLPPRLKDKALDAPFKPIPRPGPTAEALLPPASKEKPVKISKAAQAAQFPAVKQNHDAMNEKPAAVGEESPTHKTPSKEIAISTTQGGKELEQERFHFQLAIASHKNKQYQKALDEYQTVLKLNPSNHQARNNIGLIYKDMGKLDRAATEYMQLISLEPNNVKAYNNLGTIYYLQGRLPEAVEEFTKALSIDGNNAESFVNLALAYKKQGQKSKAVEVFQHLLSIDTQLPEAHYNLAILMEEMGDVPTALLHFQKFVDLSQGEHSNVVEQVRRHIEELSSKQRRQITFK